MIGDPVMLTVRRNIERPSKALLKSFDGMPTGFVTDAYNGKGCLDYAIKPLLPTMNFSGSAHPLDTKARTEIESARLVLEAHESLISMDAANAAKFQDVLAFLRNRVELR